MQQRDDNSEEPQRARLVRRAQRHRHVVKQRRHAQARLRGGSERQEVERRGGTLRQRQPARGQPGRPLLAFSFPFDLSLRELRLQSFRPLPLDWSSALPPSA